MISKINQILSHIEKTNEDIYKKLEKTSLYTFALAKAIHLNPKDKEISYYAGLLHEIGKIKIPNYLLSKNKEDFSTNELLDFQKYVIYSECMLMFIEELECLCPIIKHHQEHWNGTGYPDNIKENEIPVISRIVLISSDYYSMRYEKNMTHEESIDELRKNANIKYDKNMIEPFISALEIEDLI